MSIYIHPIYKRVDIWLCLASIIIFISYPFLDLKVSEIYYNGENFTFNENPYVQFVAWLFARLHIFYLLLFLYLGIRSFYRDEHQNKKKFFFLAISLAIAYGLLTNVLLQDHSFGRASPLQTVNFGGLLKYSGPFEYSGECTMNCSFVSGHAAIAFFLFAVAWVREQRVWIAYGIILGFTVGFVRIIEGTNFLSDIVFAGWVTWFTCVLLGKKMGLVTHNPTSTKAPVEETQ